MIAAVIGVGVLLPFLPAWLVGALLGGQGLGWQVGETAAVYAALLAAEAVGLVKLGRLVRARERAARLAERNARIASGDGSGLVW
jgi:hypothetical protein